MISDFAALCGDEERLRELYLLTFCDLGVGRARRHVQLEGDAARASCTRARWRSCAAVPTCCAPSARRSSPSGRRARRACWASRWPRTGRTPLRRLFAGFPSRYFAENTETRIAAHVRLMRARHAQGKSALIDVSHDTRLGMTEMVLAAADTPGLLAEVAGVLYANRIEVVDAAIYSRQPADASEPRRGAGHLPRARQHGPPGDRGGALDEGARGSGGGRVGADQGGDPGRRPARAPNRWPAGRRRRSRPNARSTTIVSRDFTVVEVITEDRPGVLYAIARALYVAGLDIHRSKIATEANRAIDVFYVRDKATMDKIVASRAPGQLARDAARAAGRTARRRNWRTQSA